MTLTADDGTELRHVRHMRLVELMERHRLAALLLRTPANFAWYTGGADNRVNYADAVGVASVLITPQDDYIVTTNVESRRMREEQTPNIPVIEYPWYGAIDLASRPIVGDGPVGTDASPDRSIAGALDVASTIAPLRFVLDADAMRRYRVVGHDAMAAMDEATSDIRKGMTERDVAAQVAAACWRRGLHTPVILVAGDDRSGHFRHPLPRDLACQRHVMVVLCAERGGLVANLTRWTHFTAPELDWLRRQEVCERILCRMRDEAARPGRTLADIFADCQRYYIDAGFPEEWRLHHQGGLTGYASREVIATPDTFEIVLQSGHAFAWNPSITGAKAEETSILTDSGPEVIAR